MGITESDIRDCVDGLDSEQIHAMMRVMDWKWRNNGVPDRYAIEGKAAYLLRHVKRALEDVDEDREHVSAATGGLVAEWTRNKFGNEQIQVYFRPERSRLKINDNEQAEV